MKITIICLLFLALTATAFAAKPGGVGCPSVPIAIKFLDTIGAPAAIWNDDRNVAYQNGVDGVENCEINIFNGCAGSRDATMALARSTRTVWLQFPAPLPGSIIEGAAPTFAGGSPFMDHLFLNIRNITARGSGLKIPGPASTFYTRMAVQFTGPDGIHYRLGYMPQDSTCPGDFPCAPNEHGNPFPPSLDEPDTTAWVKVTYTPSPDTFLVDGEFVWPSETVIQRAGLFDDGNWIHVGQYSMPFKVLINTLAPLPAFQPSLLINDVTVTEGNSGTQNVTFTVSLDVAAMSNVTVKYGTSNSSAKSPSDYTSKSGTLTIPAGSTSTTFTVSLKGDTTVEANETFTVTLSNEVNALMLRSTGTCTILNDD